MKTAIDVNRPAVAETEIQLDEAGDIPENLATLTMQLLEIHRQNGDLGWVNDMLIDLETNQCK